MRVRKFRAWNPDSKIMVYIPNETGSYIHLGSNNFFNKLTWYVMDKGESCVYSDRGFLMEFTGFKDKHGKEIYEGDIILLDECPDLKAEVTWNKEDGSWDIVDIHDENGLCWGLCFGDSVKDGIDVIGNIYETPKLCKAVMEER